MDNITIRFNWDEIINTHFVAYDEHKSKYYVDCKTEEKTKYYPIRNSRFPTLKIGDKINLNGKVSKIKDVIFNLDETIDYICDSILNTNDEQLRKVSKRCEELNDKVNKIKNKNLNRNTKIVRMLHMPQHSIVTKDKKTGCNYIELDYEPIFEKETDRLMVALLDDEEVIELSNKDFSIEDKRIIFNSKLRLDNNDLIFVGSYVYLFDTNESVDNDLFD